MIEDDHLHSLGRELRRSTLITAIGILDFCLFEILVFMVSIRPEVLDRLPKDFRKGKYSLPSVKESLKRTGIERRLKLVSEVLQIIVAEELKNDLKPLLEKRHAITHQSKFYEAVPFGESTVIQTHAFPEVSYDESTIALLTVTEIADCVLVGVAKSYFLSDLGDLRPLNPPVATLHKSMRLKIQENRARGPEIEIIANPNWSVLVGETWVCVRDKELGISISPTSVERFPVSVFCPRHTVHGEKAYLTIDAEGKEELGLMNASFLARLLAGKSILVEYQSYSSDVPLYMRLPLEGFGSPWAEAQALKAAKSDGG